MGFYSDIIAPENMGLSVKCRVCGSIVPKGKTYFYRRLSLRYCENCKDINLQTKLKLIENGGK